MKNQRVVRRPNHSSKRSKPKISIKKKKGAEAKNYQTQNIPTSQRSNKNTFGRPVRQASTRTKSSRNFLERQSSRASSMEKSSKFISQQHNKNFVTPTHGLFKGEQRESRLRIAKPPQNLIRVSDKHWNQISSKFQTKPTQPLKEQSQKDVNIQYESYSEKYDQPTRETKEGPTFQHGDTMQSKHSHNYKTFSFLSNLGGRELVTPTLSNSIYNRVYFPKKNKVVVEDLRQSQMTIITDANVDGHEFGIQERRIIRKNIMDLTARGVIEPQIKTKMFRPSSSRPNLRIKHPPMIPKPENHSKIVTFKEQKRRPMSANPKFVTISGRNRPLSAQIKMGERKFDNPNDSIDSLDKESDDLNIPEISEVPKFDETEAQYLKNEERRFSARIMKSQPTTSSIFKQDKDFNLPYPDLFDRTERTFAACYAKFGNLSYFTAVQRIG